MSDSESNSEYKLPRFLKELPNIDTLLAKTSPGHLHSIYWNATGADKKDLLAMALNEVATSKGDLRDSQFPAYEQIKRLVKQSIIKDPDSINVLDITLESSLLCGSGLEHPTEIGFSFLNPYGIPYIPGSTIKGLARNCLLNNLLCSSSTSDREVMSENLVFLFGAAENNNFSSSFHPEANFTVSTTKGHLTFLDSIPTSESDSQMEVDILNPHFSDYLSGKTEFPVSGTPIPVFFLVVKSNTSFSLIVLHRKHNDTLSGQQCHEYVDKLLRQFIKSSGVGSKTSVGYGAFRINEDGKLNQYVNQLKQEIETKREADIRALQFESLSANERKVEEYYVKVVEALKLPSNLEVDDKLKVIDEIRKEWGTEQLSNWNLESKRILGKKLKSILEGSGSYLDSEPLNKRQNKRQVKNYERSQFANQLIESLDKWIEI